MLTTAGINGLVELQTMASENRWRVLSVQQFLLTSNISDIDARPQLSNIRGTGEQPTIISISPLHVFLVFCNTQIFFFWGGKVVQGLNDAGTNLY